MVIVFSPALVNLWGDSMGARRVVASTLDAAARQYIEDGALVVVRGPDGLWSRRVVRLGRAWYTRTLSDIQQTMVSCVEDFDGFNLQSKP